MKPLRRLAVLAVAALFCSTLPAIAAAQAIASAIFAPPRPQPAPVDLKFDFTTGPAKPGYTQIAPSVAYTDAAGYGYEPVPQTTAQPTPDRPALFSAKVPEGNYNVTVTLGDAAHATTTTVKAESGRLMLLRVEVPAGQVATRTFTTSVRVPQLPRLPLNATGREEVSLDQFDRGNTRDWDGKLTVEVIGSPAVLQTMEIVSAPTAPTIFLAGDSTMTDRDSGGDVSWGQILPVFFKAGVAVSNNAQSGETLKSFANALRLDKILSQMKQGDYLFIQFTHNDSKASWPQTYVDADTTYKDYLRVYIDEARLRGATPVLVTAMDRGARGTGLPTHGHGGYPQATRELAQQEHVALIDLYTMSQTFYSSAGADAPRILADGTHSTAYGGYEFAKCIVTGIRQNHLDLAKFIVDGFQDFDSAHPDSAAALNLDPLFTGADRPAGRAGPPPTSTPLAPANPGPGPL